MAGDIVYADIKMHVRSSCTNERRAATGRADPQAPRFQRPASWIFVFFSVLLVLAVVGSGVWNFRLQKENGDLKMRLKQKDECDGTNKLAGADPMPSFSLNWLQHGRKCYYFPVKSDEKNWGASQEDCSSRGSRLAVIEDKAELDYLTSKLTIQAWIGLFIAPTERRWTWVNGPTLNETVFLVTGPADGDRCGTLNSGTITSARCMNSFYWICQKEVESCNSRV
ncbi:killer cell lectin-like receptor subfamily B member 1B allele C [Lissotriton helveticus]